MCRLLLVRAADPIAVDPWLTAFAAMCRDSAEYQGHGWGLARFDGETWTTHKELTPIWESNTTGFGRTRWLLVHARSAFRNEGIALPNNMPFSRDNHCFIFNGELHGVRIKETGRIGAEKIFNYILRFHKGDLGEALDRATRVIAARSDYVRAMNILMSDGEKIYCASRFSEDPDYFTMAHAGRPGLDAFCSRPLHTVDGGPPATAWRQIPEGALMVA